MTKKTALRIIHVSLLVVAMLFTFNSFNQLQTDRGLCAGAMCISNADCGSGCFCSQGICFSVQGE